MLKGLHQAHDKEGVIKYLFSYYSVKTYVVGAQMNRLNETVF